MEAIILCGIQASGKSTFVRERWYESHVRINLDMLKTRNREDIVLFACLAAKTPVVIDNTNPTRAQRLRYLALARAAGYESVVLYFFETTVVAALARNAVRPERNRVLELAIRGTAGKLETPSLDEGWDRLVVVSMLASGGFETRDATCCR